MSNNAVKNAKSKYFKDNLGDSRIIPRNWKLINELTLNQQKRSKVNQIRINDNTLVSSPEIAEAFNVHFTNRCSNLASEIPLCDISPENLSYTF